MNPALNTSRRARELDSLVNGEMVDVVVIGGGVTGAGVALDAATRGLSVALLERRDLAYGTSRWSSKLVHGGLRYLAHGDVAIAWESARERALLLDRIAPHLTRALPMLVPVTPSTARSSALLTRAGVHAGDVLRRFARTSSTLLPPPRVVTPEEAKRLVPAVRHDITGGILTYDGQLEDDARLVIAIARTAAAYGARILTDIRVTQARGDGVDIVDERTSGRGTITARHVVNATGVWAADLAPDVHLRPSRGAHIVLSAKSLGHPLSSLNVPLPGAYGRWVFAMPQPDGLVYLGLTDDEADHVDDEPEVTSSERTFLLESVNRALDVDLTLDDVVGGYAGYRPLLAGRAGRTADLSRRHTIVESPDGVVTVVGGKLTTYRAMARDAVDHLTARPGVRAAPCRTQTVPLVGATHRAALRRIEAPDRLVRRYGTEATAVMQLADDDRSLMQPIAPGVAVLGVELRWGVEQEGASSADDLLDRRTRLGLVPDRRANALEAADRIVERYGARAAS